MKKLISCFIALFIVFSVTQAHASQCLVDVYGTKKISAEWVCKTFDEEIKNLIETIKKDNFSHIYALNEEAIDPREMIINQIKTKGAFEYVNLAPIIYQDQSIHITIDIVEKGSKRSLQFLPPPTATISSVDGLINTWDNYERIGGEWVLVSKDFKGFKQCPAYHCLFGFEDPKLEKYGRIFTQQVPLVKNDLEQVLRFDKDPNKRASAAYLLAHIKNEQELAYILVPQIYDPNPHVRNSILRVLGSLLSTETIDDFPKEAIIAALDFPNLTDRNKALYVLSSLARSQENHQYILQNAGRYLIANLRMKQPNLHSFAYDILKLISGENFDEYAYSEWESWVNVAIPKS